MKNTYEPPYPFFSYRLSHSHHTLPQALFSSLAPLCILCVLFFCPCLSPGQSWSMLCLPALPVEPRPFPLARSTPLFPTSSLSAHFWTLSQILLQTPRYPTPLPCMHGEDRTDWERVVVDPRDFSQSFFFPSACGVGSTTANMMSTGPRQDSTAESSGPLSFSSQQDKLDEEAEQ